MPYESPSGGARWLNAQWLELQRYRFQWVAANSTGVIAHNAELRVLLEELPTVDEDVAVAFVDGQEFEATTSGRTAGA